jgi:hypothetical protein
MKAIMFNEYEAPSGAYRPGFAKSAACYLAELQG